MNQVEIGHYTGYHLLPLGLLTWNIKSPYCASHTSDETHMIQTKVKITKVNDKMVHYIQYILQNLIQTNVAHTFYISEWLDLVIPDIVVLFLLILEEEYSCSPDDKITTIFYESYLTVKGSIRLDFNFILKYWTFQCSANEFACDDADCVPLESRCNNARLL